MQAVILAAGKGVRLRPLTDTTPKPLIDIGGKPLLEHTLESLPDRITEIFIVVGHLREQITERFGASWHGKPLQYVIQDPLTGTGGATALLTDRLHGKFLVVNGDDLYAKQDLERLIAHPLAILIQKSAGHVPASALLDDQGCFAGLETNAPSSESKNRVCGAYVLDERYFKYPLVEIVPHGHREWSIPHTLVGMSRDVCIKVEAATFWQPVGTPAELAQARYDRDGSPAVGER